MKVGSHDSKHSKCVFQNAKTTTSHPVNIQVISLSHCHHRWLLFAFCLTIELFKCGRSYGLSVVWGFSESAQTTLWLFLRRYKLLRPHFLYISTNFLHQLFKIRSPLFLLLIGTRNWKNEKTQPNNQNTNTKHQNNHFAVVILYMFQYKVSFFYSVLLFLYLNESIVDVYLPP